MKVKLIHTLIIGATLILSGNAVADSAVQFGGVNITNSANDSDVPDENTLGYIKINKEEREQTIKQEEKAKQAHQEQINHLNDTYKGMIVNVPDNEQYPASNIDVAKYSTIGSPEIAKTIYAKNKKIVDLIMSQTTAFAVGPYVGDDKTSYIFFDPQCPHCNNLWTTLKDPAFKDYRFIWIPIAFMNNYSAPQAAKILTSPDPVKAMEEHEELLKKGSIGIEGLNDIKINISDRIKINTLNFSNIGGSSVPLILHLNKKGIISFNPTELDKENMLQYLNE